MNLSRRNFKGILPNKSSVVASLSMMLLCVGISSRPVIAQEVIVGTVPQSGPENYVPDPPGVKVEVWVSGLKAPWSLAFFPDGRAIVSERQGSIKLIDAEGQIMGSSLIDLRVHDDDESGLMGLAVHPGFPEEPYIYAMRTYRDGETWANDVLRFGYVNTELGFDKTIIDDIPAGNNHNGGRIGFGPDGMLYVGTGDIWSRDLAQNLDSLAGKILRVTPDGEVPEDNPFPDSLVWSWGHRNVQGLAWNPDTGAFYNTEHGPSGEVGFGAWDEVNLVVKGGNFGWPLMVGAAEHSGFHDPIVSWPDYSVPTSDSAFWGGDLFFASLGSEALIRVILKDGKSVGIERWFHDGFKGKYGRLRDAVRGPDGALYVLTANNDWRGTPGHDDDRILRLTRQ